MPTLHAAAGELGFTPRPCALFAAQLGSRLEKRVSAGRPWVGGGPPRLTALPYLPSPEPQLDEMGLMLLLCLKCSQRRACRVVPGAGSSVYVASGRSVTCCHPQAFLSRSIEFHCQD